ncbi:hypothetical protein EDM56_26635 [Brevibacillus fluminis]|uniref:MFS transporter n=1 Tax=Brevibacillus fluminis TaxID=511487 RepID=A0A3M8D078_9BACL|nr:hypothetical protein [Brevibacillus fluminis]RNB81288.1 hypothetical protein EDM56_26635 [Brevibacillus fluminis]
MASGLMNGFSVGAGGIGAFFLGKLADVYSVDAIMKCFVFFPIHSAIITCFIKDDHKILTKQEQA